MCADRYCEPPILGYELMAGEETTTQQKQFHSPYFVDLDSSSSDEEDEESSPSPSPSKKKKTPQTTSAYGVTSITSQEAEQASFVDLDSESSNDSSSSGDDEGYASDDEGGSRPKSKPKAIKIVFVFVIRFTKY